jgi:hypothetical protein
MRSCLRRSTHSARAAVTPLFSFVTTGAAGCFDQVVTEG